MGIGEEPANAGGSGGDPEALDLPGPSRRIRVEPIRLPEPARRDEPAPAPDPEPRQPAPPPEPARERERDPA